MPKLTKRVVDAAHPRSARYDLMCSSNPGFGVRIFPSGTKTFFVAYRLLDRTKKRVTIGRYGHPFTVDAALTEARRILRDARTGGDPARDRRRQREAPKMSELIAEYRKTRIPAMKASTQKSESHLLETHVEPRFARRTVESISRVEVEGLRSMTRACRTCDGTGLVEARRCERCRGSKTISTPGAANKVIGLLSRLFTFAETIGMRPPNTNPARGVKKNPERKVERYLTPDERRRVELALCSAERAPEKSTGHVDPAACAVFRLLAATGMRLGEALDLRWQQVDIHHRRLSIDSKTGPKYVQLSDHAIAILQGRMTGADPDGRDEPGERLVFASSAGTRLHGMQRRWITIRKSARVPDLRIHDLRHGWASDAVMLGIPLQVVGRQLGHRTPVTTARYAHLAGNVIQDAVDQVGAVIAARADGPDPDLDPDPDSNVVPLRGRSR